MITIMDEVMDNILVTVIITTYDRPDYLRRSLSSVVNQTYKNLEILVVDGKGLQETRILVGRFAVKDSRISYIPTLRGKKTSALYGSVQAARNYGLTLAKGKYVAMLDDDDYWESNKIAIQLYYAEIFNAPLVSCHMKIRGENHIDKPSFTPTYCDLLRNFNMSCTSSYFLNRKILKRIGGFDESLRSMHEYDIALKLTRRGYKIAVVQLPLITMNRDNAKKRKFYYIKIAEVFDLYRFYGKDMLLYLGVWGFLFNIIKSGLLVTLFLLGFIFKEKIWGVIFKLKNLYQEKSE